MKSFEQLEPNTQENNVKYLDTFDLTWESLGGKKILDAGAASGEFAAAAKQNGVDVVSLEIYANPADKEIQHRESYVVGDIFKMPFKEGAFDLVLARAAWYPHLGQFTDYIMALLSIVKDGGELRIAPVPYIDVDFLKSAVSDVDVQIKESSLSEERYCVIKKNSKNKTAK